MRPRRGRRASFVGPTTNMRSLRDRCALRDSGLLSYIAFKIAVHYLALVYVALIPPGLMSVQSPPTNPKDSHICKNGNANDGRP
jgi:hypothetical protein